MSRATHGRPSGTATDNPVVAVATAHPPIVAHGDDPLHVHALHVLLLDARLNALSTRAANDRALHAVLPRMTVPDAERLLAEVARTRLRDTQPTTPVFQRDGAKAELVFRDARRAVRIENSLTDLLAHVSAPNSNASTPGTRMIRAFDGVADASQKHRIAHLSAAESLVQGWPVTDGADVSSTFHVGQQVRALRARLRLLHAETATQGRVAEPASSSRSGLRDSVPRAPPRASPHLPGNPFNPIFPDAPPQPTASGNVDAVDPYAHAHPYASPWGGGGGGGGGCGGGGGGDMLSGDAPPPHLGGTAVGHGRPWPPSPHYYYMPPYGHPYGHFPPLYDGTPVHFPLTERLLRDTPSRQARYEPGSTSLLHRDAARVHVTELDSADNDRSDDDYSADDQERGRGRTRESRRRRRRESLSPGGAADDRHRAERQGSVTGQPRVRARSKSKRTVSRLADMVQGEGAGRIASVIMEKAPGMPRNLRRMSRVGRAVRVISGREDETPSGAELAANAVGYVMNKARDSGGGSSGGRRRRRHSVGSSYSGRHGRSEEGPVGRLASQAMNLVSGRRDESEHGLGGLASHAMQHYMDNRRSGGRRNSFGGSRHGQNRHDSGGGRHGRRRESSRRYASDSESEEGGGLMGQALQYAFQQGRSGGSANMLSQVGKMVAGAAGGRQHSRDGRGETVDMVMNALGEMVSGKRR